MLNSDEFNTCISAMDDKHLRWVKNEDGFTPSYEAE